MTRAVPLTMNDHVSNFSSPEFSRIFSVPASQSLRASTALGGAGSLITGLERLDTALSSKINYAHLASTPDQKNSGIPKGHVTEVYGPPGVGKTNLLISVAALALQAGEKVIWIDTGSPLPFPRLTAVLASVMKKESKEDLRNSSSQSQGLPSMESVLERFHYVRAQSLPHLLSLLFHPPSGFPPEGTNLLVLDSISAFFPSYFPNTTELKSRLQEGRISDNQHLQWLLNRKWTIAGDVATNLMKLSASRQNLAVVLINQTHTKIRGQLQATLFPVVSGASWDACIHNRIVLYRDWSSEGWDYASQSSPEDDSSNSQVRYAEVIKRAGRTLTTRINENIAPFVIDTAGLHEIQNDSAVNKEAPSQSMPQLAKNEPLESPSLPISQPRKRKVDEVADSEEDDDEAFDWIENDDSGLSDEERVEDHVQLVEVAALKEPSSEDSNDE